MRIFSGSAPAKGLRRVLRPTHIPAVLALVVILTAWFYAEHQNRLVYHNTLRSQVLTQVSIVRARIEGQINSNIQLVRGFVAALTTEPDMSEARFSQLARALVGNESQLRHLAAAPDLVITKVYPREGNEAAIGRNYRDLPNQIEGVLRARDTGKLVLAGPLELVQGGVGLIGRFPVFVPEPSGAERFWGIVSAVIDVDRIYADTAAVADELGLDLAIARQVGGTEEHIFGNGAIHDDDPVIVEVALPYGRWHIEARPQGGWDVEPSNVWRLRAWVLLAAALIMVPAVVTGRLLEERLSNMSKMQIRRQELENLSRRLKLALDTSKVAIWETSLDEDDEYWDERMHRLYGVPIDGKARSYEDWIERVHPDDRERATADYRAAVVARGSYVSQFRIITPAGLERHVRALGRIHADEEGRLHVVGVNWDVTDDIRLTEELTLANAALEARNDELEQARRRIEYTALHDALTGLPNRRYLDEVLADHAKAFDEGRERAAILHIDLDRFKQINDTLGHAAGDAMLVHAADILRQVARPTDFVARAGGDEFIIVCREPMTSSGLDADTLSAQAELILGAMQQPLMHEGHECRCGVSIGISGDMDTVADPRRLLVNADIALYRAKNRGRNRYQFFNDTLEAEIVRTKRVADDILAGLERGEFVPFYQPQFDATTLDVIGVEALVRWNHPTEGTLAPGAFLKIAEELNVVGQLDRIILEQTIADLAAWKLAGLPVPKASVNVSARRLHDDGLIDGLRALSIEPGTISFELVESIFLDDNDDLTTWNVQQIKALGIDIEIDDFGTGHASIVSLLKLSPRRLKIDRQFVMPILRSEGQRQLVRSIVEIGRSLGIDVLAEGVETMDHARVLKSLGCNALQGYAFARPMAQEDLVTFLKARRWRKAS